MDGILENTFLNVKNTSKTIVANVSLTGNDHGIILCQGGKFGGWAFYMNEGKPSYTYNYFGLESYAIIAPDKISAGDAEIKLEYAYDGDGAGKGGTAKIFVNGKMVAEGRVEKSIPAVFSADETADVGKDDATQVADQVFANVKESEFTGYVNKVTISIPE